MLAAATSFFARSAIYQSYSIGGHGSRPTSPGTSAINTALQTNPSLPSITVGLWKVQPAFHKVTNKSVSVWSFDKRGPDMDQLGPGARERTMEVLKAEVRIFLIGCPSTLFHIFLEASALSRLRHPSVLGKAAIGFPCMCCG